MLFFHKSCTCVPTYFKQIDINHHGGLSLFSFTAVKKCRFGTDSLLTPKQKERWKKEVEIMMRLNHPNVVTVFPVPEDIAKLHADLPMLCMEYCNRGDLRQVSVEHLHFYLL